MNRLYSIQGDANIEAVVQILKDRNDEDSVRNEAINLLARSKYPDLAKDLVGILNDPQEDARFRAFATQHLGILLEDPDYAQIVKRSTLNVEARLMEAFDDRDQAVRKEALFALARGKNEEAIETIIKILQSEDENAQGMKHLAIRIVRDLELKGYIPTIRNLVQSTNESTQIAAIVALSEWNDKDSVAAFEAASQSPVPRIRNAGRAALARMGLSGMKGTKPPTAPDCGPCQN